MSLYTRLISLATNLEAVQNFRKFSLLLLVNATMNILLLISTISYHIYSVSAESCQSNKLSEFLAMKDGCTEIYGYLEISDISTKNVSEEV